MRHHNSTNPQFASPPRTTLPLSVALAGQEPNKMGDLWFLVFGLLRRNTASNPITAQMHTSGVQ